MAQITVHRLPFSIKAVPRPIVLIPALGALVFLSLPWSIEHKAHVILHGLCAQRPGHTYYFGDRPLPFDARMMGIYLSFAATMAVLLCTGSHRWCRSPSPTRIGALLTLGGVMAIDGFNSLLKDLEAPYPYEPRNWLRVITGAGAGVVLAVALCFLLSITLWHRVDIRKQTLESWSTPLWAAVVTAPLLLVAMSGIDAFYAPMVLLLIVSALAALTALSLVIIVIFRRLEYRFATARQLEPVLAPAMLLAVAIMIALSIGRTVLEHWTGPMDMT
jgi:uncharacterized membrane protein